MALSDLTPKDMMRLYAALSTARAKNAELVPPRDQMLSAIREAVEAEGDLGRNVASALGEPVRRGVELIRSILVQNHGAPYADDLWARLTRKNLG